MNTVEKIERAIGTLSASELGELYTWLDRHFPHPVDARLSSDLADGRLDAAIQAALGEESNGRVQPL